MLTRTYYLISILLLIVIVGVFPSADYSYADAQKHIGLFVPRGPNDYFFKYAEAYAHKAASDLNFKLTVHYARGSHLRMVEQVDKAVNGVPKPDAIFFYNIKKRDKAIFDLAEKAKVYAFIVDSGSTPQYNLGQPREKYHYWLGDMLADNVDVGYQLAKILVETLKKRGVERFNFVGIQGELATLASSDRVEGLLKAIEDIPGAHLHKVFNAPNWSKEKAKKIAKSALMRYLDTNIIWAASDEMAIGVYEILEELNKQHQVVTGGVDWTDDGIEGVQQGKIVASVGGHMTLPPWAFIMFYDYLNGHDFSEIGLILKHKMIPVTKENIDRALQIKDFENISRLDFKQFTFTHNPNQTTYNFTIPALLRHLSDKTP